jgi:hypothetical protein
MNKGFRNLGKWSVVLAIYLELVFPLVFGSLELLLLTLGVISFVVVQVSSTSNKVIVVDKLLFFVVLLVLINSFFVCVGVLKGASEEGIAEAFKVYTLFPLAWIGLIVLVSGLLGIQSITRLLIAVSLSISVLTLVQSAKVSSGVDVPGYNLLSIVYSGLETGSTSFLFTGGGGYLPRSMERLALLSGFSVALVSYANWFKVSNKIIYINAVLVVMAVIVSERRIFIIATVLTLGVVFLRWLVINVSPCAPGKWVFRLVSGVLVLGTVVYLGVENTFLPLDHLIGHLTTSVNEGGYDIRTEQMMVLLEGFSNNLLFGAGFGNDIEGYFRNINAPWRFEMTYNALLYQTGIIGFCLYMLLAGQLLEITIRVIKLSGEIVMPYVAALACALLAISTNPYLNYGSGQWLIFTPLIAFNILLAGVVNKLPSRIQLASADSTC